MQALQKKNIERFTFLEYNFKWDKTIRSQGSDDICFTKGGPATYFFGSLLLMTQKAQLSNNAKHLVKTFIATTKQVMAH